MLRAIRLRIRSTAYLRKWVVLGTIIGVISGLGAAVFFVALDLGTRFFLGVLAGFTPASPLERAPVRSPTRRDRGRSRSSSRSVGCSPA